MPAYLRKSELEILREALKKVETNSPITSTGPGSIARALIEVMSKELGQMYEIMDFNVNQSLVTSASGTALDLLGSLYGIQRKTLSEAATIDKALGSFYFYLDSPVLSDIVIPAGTNVYTNVGTYVGRRFSYSTTDNIIIPSGRRKAYASLKPNFADSVFTAGVDTLILHDAIVPAGVILKCTNPKTIAATTGYEDDNAFRLRIIKSIRVAASGTAEAVRFAGLSANGVRDVRIRQAPYGMGTFEAVVVPETGTNATTAYRDASVAMEAVRPLGVRMIVNTPILLPVNISLSLVTPAVSVATIRNNIISRAQIGLTRYLNSLMPGDSIVYNKVIQIILDSSEYIKDVVLRSFAVNGTEVLRRNYQPKANEQLVPGTLTIDTAIS